MSPRRCSSPRRLLAQERSIWALVVNDEPKGDVEIVLTADGPWVDPSVLLAAGLQTVPDGRRQTFTPDTISRVSLNSLAPQITFTLDEAEIRLLISADPALLAHDRAGDLQPAPARMEGHLEQRHLPELFRELVHRRHDLRLRRARRASLRRPVRNRRQRRRKRRGHARTDQPDVRSGSRRGAAGSSATPSGDRPRSAARRWSAASVVSTQQDLDPYYAIYPAPQIRGAVRTPSTADVYVDDRLVSSVRLPPGQFTLNDLPIETGSATPA